MNYNILFLLVFFFLFSCSAQMVVAPGGNRYSKYAPINENKRHGIIKYLNDGATPIINARRENAYRQMHESCKGKYIIIKESPYYEGGLFYSPGKGSMFFDSQYIYIEFECIKEDN